MNQPESHNAYDRTIPGGSGEQYSPDHEDYMSPDERAEALRLFRPVNLLWAGRLRGAASAEEVGYLQLVDDEVQPQTWAWGFTKTQWVLLVLAATVAGGLVGWWIRERRAQPKKRSRDLVGLDVVCGAGDGTV